MIQVDSLGKSPDKNATDPGVDAVRAIGEGTRRGHRHRRVRMAEPHHL